MKRVLPLLLLCTVLSTGCYRVTYQNPLLPPNGVVHEGTSGFFIMALVGDERIPAYQMCPGGVSRISTYLSFVDMLLTLITFTIYTPRSYEIECGGMAPMPGQMPMQPQPMPMQPQPTGGAQ